MARFDLTDTQWERLAPLLPPQHSGKPGRPYVEHRRVLNGILWVLHTGAPWADMPERYGPHQTASYAFVRTACGTKCYRLCKPKPMPKVVYRGTLPPSMARSWQSTPTPEPGACMRCLPQPTRKKGRASGRASRKNAPKPSRDACQSPRGGDWRQSGRANDQDPPGGGQSCASAGVCPLGRSA